MAVSGRACVFLSILLWATGASAQQSIPPGVTPGAVNGTPGISLDVVVTPNGGAPVAGLTQQDFTVLDNNIPQKITSFSALGGSSAPVAVIIVVDAVNTSYTTVAYERDEIDKVLRANGGKLTYPTALAIFTDKGTQLLSALVTDGNALSAVLDNYAVGLRTIQRSSGFYGAGERVQISINAVQTLAGPAAMISGRKLVLWVSPGWPLLTGPHIDLGPKTQDALFNTIVSLSTRLRQARITLYNVDPTGAADAASNRLFYYQTFLKGIRKPSQVDIADISLPVLATQTGGLVLNASNDVAALLTRALADTNAYYEISFDRTPDEPNQYHQIKVQVAKPGLVARTRTGYYSGH